MRDMRGVNNHFLYYLSPTVNDELFCILIRLLATASNINFRMKSHTLHCTDMSDEAVNCETCGSKNGPTYLRTIFDYATPPLL